VSAVVPDLATPCRCWAPAMIGAMPPRNRLRLADFVPLAGFLIPSVVIGYGFVLPRAGFTGLNELTIGFAATLLGASITYVVGVVMALRR